MFYRLKILVFSEMEETEIKNKLMLQLEGQDMLEAKILLEKIQASNDVKELCRCQWVPLTTNLGNNAQSDIVALVSSDTRVGLGPVLLHQVIENIETSFKSLRGSHVS